jgi:leucyl/phenylalanyl-tRNA---protein transferase
MVRVSSRASVSRTPQFFPPVEPADAAGLIGVGGELNTPWLLDAYQHGIFPWPLSDGLLAWWSPDPRAVIEFDRFHPSRRLLRTCRAGRFQVTFDRDFRGVIHGCATSQERCHGTWITPQMQTAYVALHDLGVAHSVEAWDQDILVGGVYGLSIGGYFAAESMFYQVRDASKVALVALVDRLRSQGFQLLDIQQLTPHTESLGASTIPRAAFLTRLRQAQAESADFGPHSPSG